MACAAGTTSLAAPVIANLFDWLNSNAPFNVIGTALGYVTLAALLGAVWHFWTGRCKVQWCMRQGEMPVEDTVWRTCCKHAMKPDHERLRREHDKRDDIDDCVTY